MRELVWNRQGEYWSVPVNWLTIVVHFVSRLDIIAYMCMYLEDCFRSQRKSTVEVRRERLATYLTFTLTVRLMAQLTSGRGRCGVLPANSADFRHRLHLQHPPTVPTPNPGRNSRLLWSRTVSISLTSDRMRIPVDPPCVPIDDDGCGRYVTSFQLASENEGTQFSLGFEGVDSTFTL
jgi:hypothetical protein